MTLAPDDFESLVADLFSKEWGARLETFKVGKDQGIDLRHSRTLAGEPEAIVQCKRYRPDRFAALARALRDEQSNLRKLNPTRYVVATSVPLSDHQKDKLLELVSPWCRGKDDIYGASELNGLLRMHPDVVQAHFKLWISGTAILSRVLHAEVFALSEANIELARSAISRLVVHDGLAQAMEILEERRHVLVLGNPGIGKSTLARMMMCKYINDGFEPVWTTTIRDAWKVADQAKDTGRKIFVVLDDFLGRLRFDDRKLDKDEDRSLFTLLDYAAHRQNLRLVLTTREYILQDAKRASGLLDERGRDLHSYTLLLDEYSRMHRARIVFNHLYFSDLPDSRLQSIVESQTYQTIIDHRHFNPRVVETISKAANSRSLTDAEYLEYVAKEFANPKDLWRHPFENEIVPRARTLLFVLWTFGGECELTQLQFATSLIQTGTAAEERQVEFEAALRQLDGNFFEVARHAPEDGDWVYQVSFQNPSVEEFVEQRIASDARALLRMIDSVVTFKQVNVLLLFIERLVKEQGVESRALYGSLRDAAARLGSPEDARPDVWRQSEPLASRMQVLLRIERHADVTDERSNALREMMMDLDFWTNIIDGSQSTDSIPKAAKRLAWWIDRESGWIEEDRVRCAEAMRYAVIAFLSGEDAWALPIESLFDLLDGFWSLVADPLADLERDVISSGVSQIIDCILLNTTNPDEVKSEIHYLGLVGTIVDKPFSREIAQLREYAQGLEERQDEDRGERPVPPPPTTIAPATDGDIEQLFSGLLQR
jgi:hypothetical protein